MMRRAALVLAALAILSAGCFDDDITIDLGDCRGSAPTHLNGSFRGTLMNAPLTLHLTEICAPPAMLIFDAPHWAVTGGWDWNGLSGTAHLRWGNTQHEYLSLYRGAQFSSQHLVQIIIPEAQLPATGFVNAMIVGRWPTANDMTQVEVTLDSTSIQLFRVAP
jgi:hypothetical protein